MQKTLARGEQTIYACRVIDSCCQRYKAEGDKKTYKKYIKLSQWKAVMEAGLRDSVIARYSDGQGAEDKPNMPRVTLQLPPAGDERACALYHNELMRLCLLPLSTLFDRIREKNEKSEKKRARTVEKEASQGAAAAKDPRREEPQPKACSAKALGDAVDL